MSIFKILLCFKVPNSDGVKLDFRSKNQDIKYSVFAFNRQFKNEKVIKALKINDSSIEFLLKINNSSKVTAREITYFSKRLHNDFDWKRYSRDGTKLFTAKQFLDVTDEFIDDFDKLEEITDFNNEQVISIINEDNGDITLSDDEAINALKALICIKNIGSKEVIETRNEILAKIKNLLIIITQ